MKAAVRAGAKRTEPCGAIISGVAAGFEWTRAAGGSGSFFMGRQNRWRSGGYREYSESAIDRVRLVQNALRFGISLKQVKAFEVQKRVRIVEDAKALSLST